MKKNKLIQKLFTALLLLLTINTIGQTLIISEVADPGDVANARFVELYNASSSSIDLGAGSYYLTKQTNGNNYYDVALTGTVNAGETYVVAASESDFTSNYIGKTAQQYNGNINGNGDDAYSLYVGGNHTTGTLVDIYGVKNQDGTGTSWEYKDGRAERVSSIGSANTTWTSSEWTITSADVADMTPQSHTCDFPASSTPTKLVITSVTPSSPEIGQTFSVTIQSKDDSDIAGNVDQNTDIAIALQSGSGTLTGTLTATILSGTSSIIISGLSYDVVEDININASVTSGMALTTSANQTITIQQASVTPTTGDIFFSEFGSKGVASDYNDEYIEIYNASSNKIDLSSVSIKYYESSLEGSELTLSGTINPGAFAIIAARTSNSFTDEIAVGSWSFNKSAYAELLISGSAVDYIGNSNDKLTKDINYERINYTTSGLNSSDWLNIGTASTAGSANTNIVPMGNGDWFSAGTWAYGVVPTAASQILITAGTLITIPGAKVAATCHDITLQSGAQLTVDGTLNVTNDLTIESDATGSGSLINTGTLSVGNVTEVQQYLSTTTQTYNWHYVAIPFGVADASIFPGVDPGTGTVYASYWQEDAGAWSNITDGIVSLSNNTGYAVPLSSNSTINYTGGSLISGSQDVTGLTFNAGSYEGFNLVGNSFTAAYDASVLTGSNWTQDIWVRSDGNFVTYNVAGGTGTLTGGTIPALQAFWVKVNSGGGGITVDPANLTHSAATTYKNDVNQLVLSTTNETLTDKTIVYFNNNASQGFNNYDTEKRFADDPNYPQIFSLSEAIPVAINGLENLSDNVVLPIGFKTNIAGNFTISADLSSLNTEYAVYLIDKNSNKTINLKEENNYEFYSDVTNSTNRFEINISKSTTGINTQTLSNNIYAVNHTIYINNTVAENTNINIYDISGRQVYATQKELTTGLNTLEVNQPAGVYFVSIRSNNATTTQKVIIK